MKSVNRWDTKIRSLYVIAQTKTEALQYVARTKNDNFEISNICYLGYELSGCMFKGGKNMEGV
jgi:hypothetical protein